MLLSRGRCAAAGFALLALPLTALADGVAVKFSTSDPAGSIFPTNRYTVIDGTQLSMRRVALPAPDCTARPSDCEDIAVINTLDGFSTQPRITVPFTGDIDLSTVNGDSVYLINLGDAQNGVGAGQKVGINQVLWDPATRTLAFESDQLLSEHSRYAVVVTDGVRDARGKKIKSDGWGDELNAGNDREGGDYRRELRDALRMLPDRSHVVAASVFTTQTATADLYKIMKAIKQSTPAPVDFMIGNNGTVRALFPVAGTSIVFNRQIGTAPNFSHPSQPMAALGAIPNSVAQIAYGRFTSPDYQTGDKYIPPVCSLSCQPQPQGSNQLILQLFIPAGARPANGWPVAIFGHGFTDSMYGAPWAVASVLASRGIATLAINVVGHGGGALGTLSVTGAAGTVTVPAGGRGIDQDGNGSIDSTEGVNAAAPRSIISSRDGLRQTVIDLMQLVRQVQAGMDVDGDGRADLDAQRIYYAGQSFGGIYGTILLGVEPDIKAGVPNVAGGSIIEVARLGVFRPLVAASLAVRTPSLLNLPNGQFNENIPLRNLPPKINDVAGAMAIQQMLDRSEWVQQAGNPVSYAPYIRRKPMPGNAAKPVIFQFGHGDQTVPNPTTSAIIRAGDLADVTTQYHNEIAFGINPAVGKNPHTFLTSIGTPANAPFAIAAQSQIAVFFQSHGATIIDPDGASPIFEVPTGLPLLEGLSFIP